MNDESNTILRAGELLAKLRDSVGKALVGQTAVVDQTIIALCVSGHVLVEGVPGLGKTLLIRALAQAMSLNVARIQFTPDLMPSDITGHAVLDSTTREMRVVRGPVFTNLLLADEINRAPAKTQSALLEVMQEYQVTLEGQTLLLPKPFMVLATQNPVETEGTYPLPEAQLDRFLLKIVMNYPSEAEEVDVVLRTTTGQNGDQLPLSGVTAVLNERAVLALQNLTARQHVDQAVVDYAVRIARVARRHCFGAGRQSGRADGGTLIRDSGRRQVGGARGDAPPHRAVRRRAARRAPDRRSAPRHSRVNRRASRVADRMFTAVIPSRQLIAIAAGGAAICTALAFASTDSVVVEGAALAGGVLLFALCGADLLLSVLDWRRAPLEMR